ncbi:MAG: HypC/HybG/HupF family hydrogenase formation chaperone [Thermoguttaceae bacterium]|nr:HypC/HybG/HupF family hydrogenase formation chaperone [Thermoguttaceae bacterium]MDW8078719.1 HypC/HybG/HupF family hydrogenase formation chaperone [Thermoguttaceae bacterium]
MCLGIPAKVTEIYRKDGLLMARAEVGGIAKEICLEYTPEAKVGDYVVVHVGFAISILDETEAQEMLATLRELAEQLDPASYSRPIEPEAPANLSATEDKSR